MCLALLLLFIHNIETHQLNHTDLEPRYQGDGPFAPTYDSSINTFYHINYCQPREACKRQFREEFMCRCTNQKMCVSPGKYYDAFCQIEIMGVVWIQPKIIEYHGKIIVLSPSSPHKSQLELLTFDDRDSRKWDRKRRKKAR